MKPGSLGASIWIGGAVFVLATSSGQVRSQTTEPSSATPGPANHPIQLTCGTTDVLKLVRAKVNDDTVVAFIETSRTEYELEVAEILHLKEQGVSDKVITAMLKKSAAVAAAPAPVPLPGTSAVAPAQTQVYAPPPQAPVTTVYVEQVPQPPYVYPDYYYYPAYSGWGGFYYPPVSFGFRYGGSYHGGGGSHGGGSVRPHH